MTCLPGGARSASCGRLIALAAAGIAAATPPRPAPEFVVHPPSAQQILLSQYRGKVVALEFLLTTCPHCQNTAKLMSRLQREYGPKGFQAHGVAFNDGAAQLVPDFVRSFGVNYPVGASPRDPVYEFLQMSPMIRTSVPILVLIDRKGVIRAQYTGEDPFMSNLEPNLRRALGNLLSESQSAAGSSRKRTGHGPAGSRSTLTGGGQ